MAVVQFRQMWFLKNFWKSLGGVGVLVGLYYLPADIQGLREATEPWARWLAMIEQNTALWIFSGLLVAYIFWIDLRPLLGNSFRDQSFTARPVEIISNQCEVNGEKFYRNIHLLPIMNTARKNKTLHGVRVYNISVLDTVPGFFDGPDGIQQKSISSGETAFVYLGETITREIQVFKMRFDMPDPKGSRIENFLANEKLNCGFFYTNVGAFAPNVQIAQHHMPGYLIQVQVVANGVRSKLFSLEIMQAEGKLIAKLSSVTGEFVEPQSLIGLAKEMLH